MTITVTDPDFCIRLEIVSLQTEHLTKLTKIDKASLKLPKAEQNLLNCPGRGREIDKID